MAKEAKIDHNAIISQVPVDYYQKGVKSNILQKLWHSVKLKAILSLAPSTPKRILEVGCASGYLLNEISKKYPKSSIYGVDVYRDAINYGKKRYKKINFRLADAHHLPYPNNSFDLIFNCEVLEHLVSPKKALLEIKRVIKKDGRIVIEIDSGNWLFKTVWYFWTEIKKGVWHNSHIQELNSQKVEALIKNMGLKIIEKKTFNLGMGVCFLVKK